MVFVRKALHDAISLNLCWEKWVALYLFQFDASYGGTVLKPFETNILSYSFIASETQQQTIWKSMKLKNVTHFFLA